MRRILTATALAAVAGLTAVGASAFADDGPANPPTVPPECQWPGYPEVAPTREALRELPRECQDNGRPDAPGPGAEDTPDQPSADEPGTAFDDAFFTRFWRVNGEVVGVENTDNGWVVDFDVKKLLNPPKGLEDEGVDVADQGAFLKLSKSVKITHDGKRLEASDLEADDVLVVKGKFLDDVQWLDDEDGTPTPTMRVKRIWVK
jgi:hypothetical protein